MDVGRPELTPFVMSTERRMQAAPAVAVPRVD